MILELKRGYTKTRLANGAVLKTTVPFWFTADKKIMLNSDTPVCKINTDELSKEMTVTVLNACLKGDIECDNLEALKQHLNVITASLSTQTVAATREHIAEMRDSAKVQQAEELLAKTANEIIEAIGDNSVNEDGIVAAGLNDIKVLESLVELEESGKGRKTVITAAKRRAELLEQYRIAEESEDLGEI